MTHKELEELIHVSMTVECVKHCVPPIEHGVNLFARAVMEKLTEAGIEPERLS